MSEESVRRLLAEAAATPEPMPSDVAARLDATLAELVAERGAAELPSTGVLPARARGRWARGPALRVLAAAAVVVAVAGAGFAGVGLVRAQRDPDTSAASGSVPGRTVAPSPATPTPSPSPENGPPSSADGALGQQARLRPPSLSSLTFAADAAAALRQPPANSSQRAPGPTGRTVARCLPATLDLARDTRVQDVVLDGRPALLLSFPAEGGGTQVAAYGCGVSSKPLATATLR